MSDDANGLKKRLATAEKALFMAAVETRLGASAVAPPFRRAVAAHLVSARKFELDGRDVLCDGLPLDMALQAWLGTAEATPFLVSDSKVRTSASKKLTAHTKKRSEMTVGEKGAYIREHGLAAYEALAK